MNRLHVGILAAGKGSRMYSDQAKVLHTLGGKALVQHVIDTVTQLMPTAIHLIYGHAGEQLQHALGEQPIQWVEQRQPCGTGDAVRQLLPHVPHTAQVLIVYGDVPLISVDTLTRLCDAKPHQGIALLTATLPDATGYGRIIREQGAVTGIVEQRDATPEQCLITEINTGVLVANVADLSRWVAQLTNNNAQGEYYLTDIVAMAYREGLPIATVAPTTPWEVTGVNNRVQLAQLERYYQMQQAEALMCAGVTLRDPERFDLRGTLTHGRDVRIDVNVILQGQVILGDRVTIGAGCVLRDVVIESDTIINPYSVLEGASIGRECRVGPFARLRPGSQLAEEAHVGNFVEMKQATLGVGSKAGHLSYLGDAEIGAHVNIGAGTITCNYDGANKHRTYIEDEVFIGSDSQLIAPVRIQKGATIGAGTTVTRDVEPNKLVISRVKQVAISGWQRPQKKADVS